MSPLDRFLVGIDQPPWNAIYRIAIGVAIVPAELYLTGEDRPSWLLVPFLLVVLLALRIGPLVARKVFPASKAVRDIWSQRRRTAKRHDSYQWQKLLWVGLGLALGLLLVGRTSLPGIVVSAVCLLAGAAGLARWRTVAGQREPESVT